MSLQKKDIINILREESTKNRLHAFQIKHLWLAGSYNEETQKRGSDIDLVYEKDHTVSFSNRGPLGAYTYLQNKLKRKIDIMKKENIRENIRDSILASATQIW